MSGDELTVEEARVFLDGETRRLFGLCLADFMAAAERGDLPEHPALDHLLLLTGARRRG